MVLRLIFLMWVFQIAAYAAEDESHIVFGDTGRLEGFEPYTAHESSGQNLGDLLFESLITIGPGNSYEPSLASAWEIENNGMSVLFTLKKNVYWHPGPRGKVVAFTPQDVVTTVRVINDKESEIPNKQRFKPLLGAETVASDKVRIKFKWPVFQPLNLLTFKILPDEYLGNLNALKRNSSFAKFPVGTGPYQFVESNRMGEVLLEANAKYHGHAPKIKKMVMKIYSDREIMAKALMFNALDYIMYTSPTSLPEIEGDKNLNVVSYDALNYSFLALNTARSFMHRKRIRQAIAASINRGEMLEAFFRGNGNLISGPFPTSSWAYNLNVKEVIYSPNRAKELINLEGFKDSDGDGYIEDGSGKKVVLDFLVPVSGESESIKRLVLSIKSYLKTAGIDTRLQFMDWIIWKNKVLAQHDYDITIGSWSFDDSANITSLFHSENSKQWGNNFVQFKNSSVDSLLTEANVTNNFEKKRAIYHKLHAIIADEVPYVFLWSLKHHASHHKKIRGIRVEAGNFFNRVQEWDIVSKR